MDPIQPPSIVHHCATILANIINGGHGGAQAMHVAMRQFADEVVAL